MGEKAGKTNTDEADGGCMFLGHLGAGGRPEGVVGMFVFFWKTESCLCKETSPKPHLCCFLTSGDTCTALCVVWETLSVRETLSQLLPLLGQRMLTRYSGEAQSRLLPSHVALQQQKAQTGQSLVTTLYASSEAEGGKKGA